MTRSIDSTRRLRGGVDIPCLGLGVFKSRPGGETRQAVLWALEAGYRHVDTARIYGNEADVGAALRDSGLAREEVFVTSKVFNDDHGRERARAALEDSLGRLRTDYVDLFLIHWPVEGLRLETWEALCRAQDDGLCRAIGVSNYMVRHLDELFAATARLPAVNQIELSPFLQRRDVRAACAARGIAVEAYSPLTKGLRLNDPTVEMIAERNGLSPAQVLIRWALQHDLIVLPKSVRQARIVENAAAAELELPERDMDLLDTLEEGLVTGWDPARAA